MLILLTLKNPRGVHQPWGRTKAQPALLTVYDNLGSGMVNTKLTKYKCSAARLPAVQRSSEC
jgi:hypothetical protein